MLISSNSALVSRPTDANPPSSIVPPAQLFAIAGDRFITAIRELEICDGSRMPDAVATELAIVQAESGVRVLGSALVPTTPFSKRQQAISSISSAKQAVAALQRYQSLVFDGGSRSEGGSVPLDQVSREARGFLLAGQDLLIDAIAALA